MPWVLCSALLSFLPGASLLMGKNMGVCWRDGKEQESTTQKHGPSVFPGRWRSKQSKHSDGCVCSWRWENRRLKKKWEKCAPWERADAERITLRMDSQLLVTCEVRCYSELLCWPRSKCKSMILNTCPKFKCHP